MHPMCLHCMKVENYLQLEMSNVICMRECDLQSIPLYSRKFPEALISCLNFKFIFG